ncbi:MAG: PAS domain S-box protein [Planctomycetota bacterium]
MVEFFANLFETDSFPARWYCGSWTSALGWLHICSDVATFLAYMAIPFVIFFFLRKRPDIQFPRLYYWFAAFIFACGTVHLIEAVIFWFPVYRLSGLFKLITAIVSWGTIGAIFKAAPRAIAMRSAEELGHEIDERIRVEATLRESEQRYRSLFESISDMVQSVGTAGDIQFANPAWFARLGYKADELRDLTMWDVIDPADHEACHRVMLALSSTQSLTLSELTLLGKDGRRVPVEGRASAVFEEGLFAATHWFFQDVSERRAAEEKLVEAERLSAVGQAMTGLIHESRNALARSQAGLKLLSRQVGDNRESLRYIDEALQAQRDVKHLFEQVRQYAVPPKLHLVSVRLKDVVQAAWDQLTDDRSGRQAVLEQTNADLDTACEVDEIAIRNVFRNLFENTLAACTDPVRVSISYAETSLGETPAIQVSVSDNGPGLGRVTPGQLFEPFFTTKTEGTGLGLTISKRAIESHGGIIEVRTAHQGGLHLVIQLPRGDQ